MIDKKLLADIGFTVIIEGETETWQLKYLPLKVQYGPPIYKMHLIDGQTADLATFINLLLSQQENYLTNFHDLETFEKAKLARRSKHSSFLILAKSDIIKSKGNYLMIEKSITVPVRPVRIGLWGEYEEDEEMAEAPKLHDPEEEEVIQKPKKGKKIETKPKKRKKKRAKRKGVTKKVGKIKTPKENPSKKKLLIPMLKVNK